MLFSAQNDNMSIPKADIRIAMLFITSVPCKESPQVLTTAFVVSRTPCYRISPHNHAAADDN